MKTLLKSFAYTLRGLLLMLVMACGFSFPVLAAEAEPAIVLENDGEDLVLRLQDGISATNGKIRLTYDSSTLELTQSEAGKNSGAVINDPLSGNKDAGEILVVFASASSLDAGEELARFTFTGNGTIKAVPEELKNSALELDSSEVSSQIGSQAASASKSEKPSTAAQFHTLFTVYALCLMAATGIAGLLIWKRRKAAR